MRIRVVASALVLSTVALGIAAVPAEAKAKKPVKFANCTQMHRYFKNGVAKPGAVDRVTNIDRYIPVTDMGSSRPAFSKAWYDLNKGLDRDHDGIACERVISAGV
jgi:hypothetical protein